MTQSAVPRSETLNVFLEQDVIPIIEKELSLVEAHLKQFQQTMLRRMALQAAIKALTNLIEEDKP